MPYTSKALYRIGQLYARSLKLVDKEIAHIETMAIANKLPYTASKDLREYIKLLKELETAQKAKEAYRKAKDKSKLTTFSEAELEALLSKKL